MPRNPTPLLLASGISSDRVAALLAPYRLRDIKGADANIQSMAGDPHARKALARILGDLLAAIARTADPDQALIYWDRFLQAGGNRVHLFDYLAQMPRMLHLLCCIFGNSPFLSQTLIRDPLLIYWLAECVPARRVSRRELTRTLRATLDHVQTLELKLETLRRFKRREMLRLGVRDLLRSADVPETTRALSDLATVLIQAAYEIVETDLRRHYGRPMHQDRTGRWVKTGFAVIAMGKLGGGELNFSSDIDLIYVYGSDDGHTRSEGRNVVAKSVSNEEYFEYLGRALTRALAEPTQEGLIFRVDLRLRAEGSVGRLARSLAGYEQYYQTRGQAWERQALLKAWPVAGDVAVGRAFLRRARRFVFGGGLIRPQAEIIEEIKAVKAVIDGKMEARGHTHRNVKLGIGGIREIEFLVQAIQILCGKHRPGILDRNTFRALARLGEEGFLSPAERRTLTQAYLFLRDVEHKLQMVHDLQTHALPDSRDELVRCAVRLGYPVGGERALRRFLADHRRHTVQVNRLFGTLEASGRSRIWRAVGRVMSGAG